MKREQARAAVKRGTRGNPAYVPAVESTVAAILRDGLKKYGPDPKALAKHLLGLDDRA